MRKLFLLFFPFAFALAQTIPNDPNFPIGSKALNLAGVPAAWSIFSNPQQYAGAASRAISTAPAEVPVVVIGTGIDCNHEDLRDNIIASLSQSFVDIDPDPCADAWMHETASAGVIAAQANNKLGIAGIAWGTKIISFKDTTVTVLNGQKVYWMGPSGEDTVVNALAAVARLPYPLVIVNASTYWGASPRIEAAIAALGKKAMIVAAAGNNGYTYDQTGQDVGKLAHGYPPCSYSYLPNVICVAATDLENKLAGFSNWGKPVQVAAPGFYVWTTLPGSQYGPTAGTSIAAPVVSGVIALAASVLLRGGVPVEKMDAFMLKQAVISGSALNTLLMGIPNAIAEPRLVNAPGTIAALRKLVDGKPGETANPEPLEVRAVTDSLIYGNELRRQSWISLFGLGFSATDCVAAEGTPTAALCGIRVLMNGYSLKLSFAGPNQINAYIPFDPLVARAKGDNQLVVVRIDGEGRPIVKSAVLAKNDFALVLDPYREEQ